MDRFIGPIRPSQHVTKLPHGKHAGKQSQNFTMPPKEDSAEDSAEESVGESEESAEQEFNTETSLEGSEDLPVGEARHDESGKRIDYTV